MDSIEALVNEYNRYLLLYQRPNKDHEIESEIDSKTTNAYKTNSSEIVSVPSFIFAEIKNALAGCNMTVINSNVSTIPKKALDVFMIGEEREKEQRRKSIGLKVSKIKKSIQKFSPELIRLSLKRAKRTNLNLRSNVDIKDKCSFLLRAKTSDIADIKKRLISRYLDIQTLKAYGIHPIKKISSGLISSGLTDAENSDRRDGIIRDMLKELRMQDALESMEQKPSNVRLR